MSLVPTRGAPPGKLFDAAELENSHRWHLTIRLSSGGIDQCRRALGACFRRDSSHLPRPDHP